MKINSRKKLFTSVAAVVLSAATIAAGTAFYMNAAAVDAGSTNNGITLTLSESEGSPELQDDGSVINTGYTIIPATSQAKDPTVTINTHSEAYLFVVVEDNTNSLVTYSLSSSGWNKIDNTNFSSDFISKGNLGDNQTVYYRIVPSNTNTTYHILDGDSVSYSSNIVNEDMLKNNGELLEDLSLVFSAKAIETRIVSTQSGTDVQKAAYAYEHFDDKEIENTGITTKKQLNDNLKSATSGSVSIICSLSGNLGDDSTNDAASTALNLSDKYTDITINGNSKTITFSGSAKISYGKTNQSLVLDNVYVNNSWDWFAVNRQDVELNQSNSTLMLLNSNLNIEPNIWNDLNKNHRAINITGSNCTVTISDSTISVHSSSYAIYVEGSNANIYINSGNISGKLSFNTDTKVEITGGTFINSNLTYAQIKNYVDLDNYDVKAYENASGGSAVNNPTSTKAYTRYVVTPK